jgi:hypothetical protein
MHDRALTTRLVPSLRHVRVAVPGEVPPPSSLLAARLHDRIDVPRTNLPDGHVVAIDALVGSLFCVRQRGNVGSGSEPDHRTVSDQVCEGIDGAAAWLGADDLKRADPRGWCRELPLGGHRALDLD